MFNKKAGYLLVALALMAVLLVACQPETIIEQVEVTRVITETVVEEGQTVEVTRVVTEVQEVVVEVEPEPEMEEAGPMGPPDPNTYVAMTFGGPDTLDPNLAYDTGSSALIDNVMEGLLAYNREDATSYVPVLALEVPSVENGLISEDGLTYTFNIREGVSFHDGGTLDPHDVAYHFQRGLLQSDPNGPQWLYLEPMLGYNNCADITEGIDPECGLAGDPEALRSTATPEQLAATCELVKESVVADDAAGTVTFNLAQPWGPFIATMAGTWGKVMDMEWAVANGAWDGDCGTWQNWYAPGSENDELSSIINGTGPYMLDHFIPGEEWVLTRFEDYWRQDGTPKWEGGPSGLAAIETIVYKDVTEWGTRFAALQAGDAAWVGTNIENYPQLDPFVGEFCDYKTNECTPNPDNPDGPLRKWDNLISTGRTDVFLNFNLSEGSPYIGSGQMDGNGIPPNFFSDTNARKASNYCFASETYIADVQGGRGVRNNGPIILDMLGYNPDGEMYTYDPAKCEELLATAWDGVLPETGFRLQIAFNTGNTARQTAASIFQAELRAINPLYQIETVGLPWPTFLRSFRSGQLPVAISGWVEDIHDPHNWVQPFTVGTYAGRQNMAPELKAQFQELVTAGVLAADPAEREAIYFELQQLHHDQAPQVTLSQAATARYEQRWVQGYYYNPAAFGQDFYAYSYATE